MMQRSKRRPCCCHWALWTICLAALGGWTSFASAQPEEDNTETAFTKPMLESKQSFDLVGVVTDVPVEVGDAVKKGDLLVALDDRIDKAKLDGLKIEAESDLRVKAAQAELDLARVQLANKREGGEGVFSKEEIQELELTVIVDQIKVQIEQQDLTLKKLEVQQQAVKVGKMQLRAPFDGIVAKVDVSVGEVVDPDRPAITVVKNDPLRVELYLPSERAAKLAAGQSMKVRYNENDPWTDVKVRFVAPVASAESGLHLVELELPNAESRAAGLHVMVKLPEEATASAATVEP